MEQYTRHMITVLLAKRVAHDPRKMEIRTYCQDPQQEESKHVSYEQF